MIAHGIDQQENRTRKTEKPGQIYFLGWVDPLGLASQPKSAVPSGVPLTSEQVNEIQSIDRGNRPDPSRYLPASYINSHLVQFDQGGSRLTPKWALEEPPKGFGSKLLGRPDGEFLMPSGQVDDLLRRTKGNSAFLEQELGLPAGSLDGVELVRIDVPNPRSLNLRFPTGNESGANVHWIPGGKLPTGYSEAVVDQIPKGSYTTTDVNLD